MILLRTLLGEDKAVKYNMLSSYSLKKDFKSYVGQPFYVTDAIIGEDKGREILVLRTKTGDVLSGSSVQMKESFEELYTAFGGETADLQLIIVEQTSKNNRQFLHVELAPV